MSTASFITLIANVGRIEPAHTFPDGRQIATFSAAISRKFKSKGQSVEATDWYTIKATSPHLIRLVENHIGVGDQLIINGSVSFNQFERNDGSKGLQVEVFAQDIRFNISKRRPEVDTGGAESPSPDLDDEIPF